MPPNPELIVCIPGPWQSRPDFLRQVITMPPAGSYMFAGGVLANPTGNDHVPLDYSDADEHMEHAFRLAGQGKISEEVLTTIKSHQGVAYLHFPIDLLDQRERVLKFTQVAQKLGGLGVKIESSGVAHGWDRWFSLLCGSTFDIYCSVTTLIGDVDQYYSCGMHHFGLPECSSPRSLEPSSAADLMNRFNMWQIVEQPVLASGHTFSVDERSPRFRLRHSEDPRHSSHEPFFNSHGIWNLEED